MSVPVLRMHVVGWKLKEFRKVEASGKDKNWKHIAKKGTLKKHNKLFFMRMGQTLSCWAEFKTLKYLSTDKATTQYKLPGKNKLDFLNGGTYLIC